jgi:hypothetical protein
MKFVFLLVGIWLFYRMITEWILPLQDSAKKTRQRVDHFKSKQPGEDFQPAQKNNPVGDKEYIEFEEIKS